MNLSCDYAWLDNVEEVPSSLCPFSSDRTHKKPYRKFSQQQREEMNRLWNANKFPGSFEIRNLAVKIKLAPVMIRNWFYYKRHTSGVRRRRTTFSAFVVQELCKHFEENSRPGLEEVTRIAQELSISVRQVRSWFEGRRKDVRKREEANIAPLEGQLFDKVSQKLGTDLRANHILRRTLLKSPKFSRIQQLKLLEVCLNFFNCFLFTEIVMFTGLQ